MMKKKLEGQLAEIDERFEEIDNRTDFVRNLTDESLQKLMDEIDFEDGIGENAWILRRKDSPMAKMIREYGKEEEFKQFLEFFNWLDLMQNEIITEKQKRDKSLDK